MKLRQMITMILSFSALSYSLTIESSSSGGNWNDTLTWTGYTIPGQNDDVIIKGTVSVTSQTFCNNLTIDEGTILQNGGILGWVVLNINGNITNNGTIQNNPAANELWINIGGDIVNNGVWKCTKTGFMSSNIQHISQASGVEFGGGLQKRTTDGYGDTFPLVATSDIVINASYFNGQGYTTDYFWGVFDLGGNSLTLKGSTQLYYTALRNVNKLIGLDSTTIRSIAVTNAITLAGRITLVDANVTFNNDVTISDTLQNGGTLGWLTPKFKATITNNGVIRNNPAGNALWVDCYGNVINNGTWIPEKTFFASTRVQHISHAAGVEFNGKLLKKSESGKSDTFPLVALSDIIVNATEFSCEGYKDNYFRGTFDLNGHSLTLGGATPLYRAVIRNVDTLYCNDSSVISSTIFDGPLTIAGNFTITNADVHFNGLVTVTDVLQNGGGLGWVTLNVNKGIVNNGTIRNNPKGNALWISICGNVGNNGIWTNAKTTFVDSVDQVINVTEGKNITAPVIFDSRWSSGPYQWQKNGENWGGTGKTVQFDTVSESSTGVYLCKKGDSLSRKITITSGGVLPVRPQIGHAAIIAEIPFGWHLSGSNGLHFTIQTPVACVYKLKLFTVNGRLVSQYNGIASRGKQLIPISARVSGVWLASFESGNIKETKKVIISR